MLSVKIRHQEHFVNTVWQEAYAGPAQQRDYESSVGRLPLSKSKAALTAIGALTHGGRQAFARNLLSLPYRQQGIDVIGSGYFSTVLRFRANPQEVVKIHRSSAAMSSDERQQLLETMKSQQALLVKHVGEFALTQRFSIEPHPLQPSREVVVSRQPYLAGMTELRTEAVPDEPNRRQQIGEFCMRASAMVAEDRHVPDLAGGHNLGFDGDGRLLIVDTLPLPLPADGLNPESPAMISLRRLQALNELAQAVEQR